MNYDETKYQISEIIDNERIKEPSTQFTDNVIQAIQEQTKVKTIYFNSKVKNILSYAAVVAIGLFIGTFTSYLLVGGQSNVSESAVQEFYLDGFEAEPIESFLISNSN